MTYKVPAKARSTQEGVGGGWKAKLLWCLKWENPQWEAPQWEVARKLHNGKLHNGKPHNGKLRNGKLYNIEGFAIFVFEVLDT